MNAIAIWQRKDYKYKVRPYNLCFVVENHLRRGFFFLYFWFSKQFLCPTVYHCSVLREFEEASLRWRSKNESESSLLFAETWTSICTHQLRI